MRQPGPAPRFSRTPGVIERPPAHAGEHTDEALADWGFEPIALSFLRFAPFGGSFHCATLDVRRRGTLESYF